jgi:ATP-binding cassette, subfamily C, bacterial CydD
VLQREETILLASAGLSSDQRKRSKTWLSSRAAPARTLVLLAIGAGFGNGLLGIVQAAMLAWILSQVVLNGAALASLWAVAALLPCLYIGRAICHWAGSAFGIAAAARVKLTLRAELASHLQQVGPVGLAGESSGALSTALVEQIDALDGYFANYLPQMALAVMLPLAILAAAFPVDWIAGLILLGCAPLLPVFMALVGMKAADASQRQFQTLARMSGYFLDRLQGLTTLRLFGRADDELRLIAQVSDDFRERTMGVLRIAFMSSAVLELFSSASVALVAVYVAFSLLGLIHLTSGIGLYAGLFVLMMAPDFFMPLRQLAIHYHDRAAALGASEQIMRILALPVPATSAAHRALPPNATVALRFTQTCVRYDRGRRNALDSFDLTVAPGEWIALTGASGSGKSTVLNLLLGFVRPTSGGIFINDLNILDLDPKSMRDQIAWLGQGSRLFHGTVRDNIVLGRPNADAAAIHQAAAAAHVLAFVDSLPQGLDTVVGERGFGLSGGQARRVALARAILKDAPLLLLDEPTSGLDADTAALLHDSLALASRGRTTVMATHSAKLAGRADRIVELAAPTATTASP